MIGALSSALPGALAAAGPDIAAADLDYRQLSPLIAVFAVAMLGLIVEITVPRRARFLTQSVVAVGGTLVALGLSVWVYLGLDEVPEARWPALGGTGAEGAVSVDGPGVLTWAMLLVFAALSFLLFAERSHERGLSDFVGRAADAPGSPGEAEATQARLEHTEVFPLAVFSLSGMMLFAVSNDLITMFVALEVLSLPLYVLCGVARRRRLLSQEAAMKYFLLGSFASAFFLYGAALAYGYAGSLNLTEIDTAVSARGDETAILLGAIGLLLVGLLFKVGAVPFHSWTPDVYQGAPTPVTAFMAAATKAAAFIAMMRVLFVGFGGASWDWRPVLWVIAVITMLIGSIVAISQTDVKRMLAYSSIAHAGFITVGLSGAYLGDQEGLAITSISSVLFYLLVYGIATIGAFAIVTVIRDSAGETTHLSKWAGLGKESPFLAGSFALFMLSFAGIPLTAGFIGKWAVFSAAWGGGAWVLVVFGVVSSAIAAYFYVRFIVLMFFTDPVGDGPTVAVAGVPTTVVIALAVIATVVLGVVPGPVLDLVQNAGAFVR
ncbi:NADH-quinone oxidoreductase subunit NuoN [Aeromicrobium duanguangcaii]|uniref:NADH-quinone oxidoreductase subunit NuoN n=1 Tax=Aeromicrobium duanguangcaii TaxID=2968086 RepID=UPI0020180089|nr:NADH-quinone oxidoreductase subunit NuoN [Aeromicrobium duanguangcaii]MCL3837729.1 NADH-quinone oxidoreductase subunit NuoN [Aeromicrobium duanguangcaii]